MVSAAILFDVDGTLIDTFDLYLESYRRALAPHLGYPPGNAEILERRPSAERDFLTRWVGEGAVAECHRAMVGHYRDLHSTLCEGMYDGVREMLAALRSAGLAVGVVTAKGRKAWEITSATIDFGPLHVVITEDEMDHPKPDPSGLTRAAAILDLPPGEIAYIGDSVGDLEAGRRAGMRVGAALWPKAKDEIEGFLEAIEPHSPDWTFSRPADVTRTVAPWC